MVMVILICLPRSSLVSGRCHRHRRLEWGLYRVRWSALWRKDSSSSSPCAGRDGEWGRHRGSSGRM